MNEKLNKLLVQFTGHVVQFANQLAQITETHSQRIDNLEQLAEDQARELEQLRAEVAWRDGVHARK